MRLRAWHLIIFLFSALLCFTKGFDSLDYYFSLLFAVMVSMASGSAAIRVFFERRKKGEGGAREALSPVISEAASYILIPLILITINAFRIKNCNFPYGLAFYFMGPVLSALFSTGLALFLSVLTKRAWTAGCLFCSAFVMSFAFNLFILYSEPQIFFFNPFLGYYSGALYDDVIEITGSYLLFRAANIFVLAALFAGLAAVRSRKKREVVLFILASLPVLAAFYFRADAGIIVSREQIKSVLKGEAVTEHFVIYYDSSVISGAEIEEIKLEHEFRYDQLANEMKTEPVLPIHSYIYATPEQKRALMGAEKVYIAKPWLNEIHLNRLETGDDVLYHELAHIFLARHSDTFLRIPLDYGAIPAMGIVEGAAVALTFPSGELTPHEWSAAMIKAGVEISPEKMFETASFIYASAGKSYSVAGSFFRFLLDSYGMEKFLDFYGNPDFQAVYGKGIGELAFEWEKFITGEGRFGFRNREIFLAKFAVARKGVLERICPVEIARLKKRAAKSVKDGDSLTACVYADRILEYVPYDAEYLLFKYKILKKGERREEAREIRLILMGLYGFPYEFFAEKDDYEKKWDEAVALFEHKKYGDAKALFQKIRGMSFYQGEKLLCDEWIDRIEWREKLNIQSQVP